MSNTFYSLLLGLIVLIDSIVTVKIGEEANPIILYFMKIFNLDLPEMMFWRTLFVWLAIFFLWTRDVQTKYLVFAYVMLYGILVVTIL